jgi:outer membrane protein assembly factor BamB
VEWLDHQYANLGWLFFILLALACGVLWLARKKSIPIRYRLAILSLPVIGLAFFVWKYEFRGFSGELVPRFRPRGEAVVASKVNNSLNERSEAPQTISNASFRQFLGNDRTGYISNIELSEQWDTKPPTVRWKQPIGPGWSGFVIDVGLAVTMEEYEGQDSLVALDWKDGSFRWRTLLGRKHYDVLGGGGPCSTPSIEGDRVYAQSSTGIVCCCVLKTGELIWKVDLLEKAGLTGAEAVSIAETAVKWGRSGSPLLFKDLVVLPFGGAPDKSPGGLIALDRSTGEERWRGGESQISYASPSVMNIQGVEQIVIVNESTVTGHDPANGTVMWSYDWPGQSNGAASVSQAVSIDPFLVLLSKGYGGGSKLLDFSHSTKSAFVVSPKWKNITLLKTKFTNAVYRDRFLYALSDGIMECVRAEDGKRMWKDTRDGRLGHGQLLVVGRHLLVGSEDGRCVLGRASPESFHKLGEIQVLTGVSWNAIAIAGDRVFMRNGEQAACVEVPLENSR